MSSTQLNNPEELENDLEKSGDFSFLDQTLRPNKFDEYIGQETIKQNLKILLQVTPFPAGQREERRGYRAGDHPLARPGTARRRR